jgi:hypothetical protein
MTSFDDSCVATNVKEANKRVCVCAKENSVANIVLLGAYKDPEHELSPFIQMYCITCNSYWLEP